MNTLLQLPWFAMARSDSDAPPAPVDGAVSSADTLGPKPGPAEQELWEADADPDPFSQFRRWYADAERAGVERFDAMTIATATPQGVPSARMVLLKEVDGRGFVFYSNVESRKGRELAANPRAALVFHWIPLHRQVRISGTVEPISAQRSDRYFATRPRGAQLAAAASPQSSVVPGRAALDERFAAIEAEYGGRDVPRPSYWGGYVVVPTEFEFWQGRENRFHDRLRYLPDGRGAWTIERLAP